MHDRSCADVFIGNHDITLDNQFYSDHGSDFHNQSLQNPAECQELLEEASSILWLKHEEAIIDLQAPDGPRTTFKIFGSPYSPTCGKWAFGYGLDEADALWERIPLDADIVVTHTPPKYHLDERKDRRAVGCEALRRALWRVRPRIAICGHVHESRGAELVRWDLGDSNSRYKESGGRWVVALLIHHPEPSELIKFQNKRLSCRGQPPSPLITMSSRPDPGRQCTTQANTMHSHLMGRSRSKHQQTLPHRPNSKKRQSHKQRRLSLKPYTIRHLSRSTTFTSCPLSSAHLPRRNGRKSTTQQNNLRFTRSRSLNGTILKSVLGPRRHTPVPKVRSRSFIWQNGTQGNMHN